MLLHPFIAVALCMVSASPVGEDTSIVRPNAEAAEDPSTINPPVRALDRITHLFSGKHKHSGDCFVKDPQPCGVPPPPPPVIAPGFAPPLLPLVPVAPPMAPPPGQPIPSVSPKVMVKVHTETDTVTSYAVNTEYETYTTTITDTHFSTATHVFYPEHTHTFTRTQEFIVWPGYTMEAVWTPPPEPMPCKPVHPPCFEHDEDHHYHPEFEHYYKSPDNGLHVCDLCPHNWVG